MGLRVRLFVSFCLVISATIAATWIAAGRVIATAAARDTAAGDALVSRELDRFVAAFDPRLSADVARAAADLEAHLDASSLDLVAFAGGRPTTRREARRWDEAQQTMARAAADAGLDRWVLCDPGGRVLAGTPEAREEAPWTLPRGGLTEGAAWWDWASDADVLSRRALALLPSRDRGLEPVTHVLVGERRFAAATIAAQAESALGPLAHAIRVERARPGSADPAASDGAALIGPRGSAVARLAGTPRDPSVTVANELARALGAGALAGAAAGLALALVLGATVARPLARLTRAVVAATDESARPTPMPRASGEAGRLGNAVDRLLATITSEKLAHGAALRAAAWRDVAQRVAHEVKNPLTPIRLAVDNLRRAARRSPDALLASLDAETKAIDEEVARLDRLVKEFAEFARLPAPVLAPVALEPVAREALAAQIPDPERVRGEVRVEPGTPDALADRALLMSLLQNLVRNAVTALGERPGTVTITVGPAADGHARIIVDDDGPGIDPDLRDRLFEPYVTGGRGAGTGLGLAIARRIALEHGGALDGGNRPEGGARFALLLRAANARRRS